MTQVYKYSPKTPKQADRRRTQIDRLLEPELFKALGDPTRSRLIACLIKCGRPCSVTEIAECCTLDFSMVARHLSALARAGLLEANKTGRTMWYAADGPALSQRFRALADAIDASVPSECCEDTNCGCATPQR